MTSNDDTFAGMFELLAQAKPAGGAALGQVAIATGAAGSSPSSCCGSGWATAAGRSALLGRVGPSSERVSGLPAWAAIPAGIIVVSLITALFGMLWDISLHIAQGRDEGPLANVAHYFILAGLFGVFASRLPVDVPAAGEAVARRPCRSRRTGTRRSAAC